MNRKAIAMLYRVNKNVFNRYRVTWILRESVWPILWIEKGLGDEIAWVWLGPIAICIRHQGEYR